MTTINKKYYVNVKELMKKQRYPRPRPRLLSGYPIISVPSGEDK